MASPVDHSERVLLFLLRVWEYGMFCFLGESDGGVDRTQRPGGFWWASQCLC